MSSRSPLHRLATQYFDDHYKPKQSESFLSQPEHTIWVSRHRTLRTQYLHFGVFLWKQYIILARYKDFYKLQNRQLATEIVIFINVCWQIRCFSGDSFSFFRSSFINIPLTFSISCEVQTRYSKSLKYYDGHQGKNLDLFWIWCCF